MKRSLLGTPIAASEITPREIFEQRRTLIRAAAAGVFGAALSPWFARSAFAQTGAATGLAKLAAKANAQYLPKDKLTRYKDATTYNNYWFTLDMERASSMAWMVWGWKPKFDRDSVVNNGTTIYTGSTMFAPGFQSWQWAYGSQATS